MAGEERRNTGFEFQPVLNGCDFNRQIGSEARSAPVQALAARGANFHNRDWVPLRRCLRQRMSAREQQQTWRQRPRESPRNAPVTHRAMIPHRTRLAVAGTGIERGGRRGAAQLVQMQELSLARRSERTSGFGAIPKPMSTA